MLAVQEDSKVRSKGLAVCGYRSREEFLLNLLRESAPTLSDCLGQGLTYLGIGRG